MDMQACLAFYIGVRNKNSSSCLQNEHSYPLSYLLNSRSTYLFINARILCDYTACQLVMIAILTNFPVAYSVQLFIIISNSVINIISFSHTVLNRHAFSSR